MGALLALCIDLLTGASFVLSYPVLSPLPPSASSDTNTKSAFFSYFFFVYPLLPSNCVTRLPSLCYPYCTASLLTISSHSFPLFFHTFISLSFPFPHLIFSDYLLSHSIFTVLFDNLLSHSFLTACRARTSHVPRIRTARELDHEGASKKR